MNEHCAAGREPVRGRDRMPHALTIVLVLLLAGCGLAVQARPEPFALAEPPASDAHGSGSSGDHEVAVFFVRGRHLEPVARSAAPEVGAALDLLVAGPTLTEVRSGLRTALSPQPLVVDSTGSAGPAVTIEVTREFTDVSGSNQLLAVAQVVWTATEFPGVDVVRVTSDGRPVEVPTDDGLTDQPVGRSDYASVAPPHDGSPPSTPDEQSRPEQSPTAPASPATMSRDRKSAGSRAPADRGRAGGCRSPSATTTPAVPPAGTGR